MIHIVIEGLDGTGKSTLISALHEKMLSDSDFNRWIFKTKEPGLATTGVGSIPFNRSGVDIREIVLTNQQLTPLERELLFYVDASQHRRFIKDQENAIVLSDRGYWSHLAYLRATLKTGQIDYNQYLICLNVLKEVCPRPAFVIYLQGSLELMKERISNKVKDVIESNSEAYFSYVLETYEDLALDQSRSLILNARNSTSQNVEIVLKSLKERFTHEQLKSGNL